MRLCSCTNGVKRRVDLGIESPISRSRNRIEGLGTQTKDVTRTEEGVGESCVKGTDMKGLT